MEIIGCVTNYKKDSFDFIIESIGVFSNKELVKKACNILNYRLDELNTLIDTDKLIINSSNSTMLNCFDVILENEDYTIGKIVEYMLYSKFFEGLKTLTYCGFKKCTTRFRKYYSCCLS